jgi:60 kDa SS-A/Ro ribonucleoprotein
VTTRRAAYRALPDICRTASTLFQLLSYLKGRRGWSRGLRKAVAKWYDDRPVDELAYQLVKYRARHEFTHRDVLRLAHPNGDDDRERRQALYAWAATKPHEAATLPSIVRTYEAAKSATTDDDRLGLAATLPREALPTEWLNDPHVWESLLHAGESGNGMPATALLRNLANLSKHGVLVADSPATELVAKRLEDGAQLRAARVHPIAIYLAAATYASGRGVKGSGTWAPVGKIVNALDRAFELAFANVRPTGKRVLVAVDVSGSMAGPQVANTTLTAAKVASAMAFVTAKTEPWSDIIGFDWAPGKGRYASYAAYPTAAGRSSSGIYAYEIAPDERLRDFQARFATPGGGTDCSLPLQYAIDRGKDLDAIVIFTDNETWAGDRHPQAVLETYRKRVRHRVKVVVAAVTATARTIADPEDRDVLQIAGFSADVPTVINDFLRR